MADHAPLIAPSRLSPEPFFDPTDGDGTVRGVPRRLSHAKHQLDERHERLVSVEKKEEAVVSFVGSDAGARAAGVFSFQRIFSSESEAGPDVPSNGETRNQRRHPVFSSRAVGRRAE